MRNNFVLNPPVIIRSPGSVALVSFSVNDLGLTGLLKRLTLERCEAVEAVIELTLHARRLMARLRPAHLLESLVSPLSGQAGEATGELAKELLTQAYLVRNLHFYLV